MKNKTRTFTAQEKILYSGTNYTILVYGELKEDDYMDGFIIKPVQYTGRGKAVVGEGKGEYLIQSYHELPSRTKRFNMGWAICNEADKFDLETGIKIAKKRFSKSDITTQNGRFLTKDMICAIINNEVEYIIQHISEYIPRVSEKTNETKSNFNNKNTNSEMVLDMSENDIRKCFKEYKQTNKKEDDQISKGNWVVNKENDSVFGVVMGISKNFIMLYWERDENGINWFKTVDKDTYKDAYKKMTDSEQHLAEKLLRYKHNKIWLSDEKRFKFVY